MRFVKWMWKFVAGAVVIVLFGLEVWYEWSDANRDGSRGVIIPPVSSQRPPAL